MLKEFKNVSVNYEADAIIEINDKKYKIHDCVDGEDILVDIDGKYPKLSKVVKLISVRLPSLSVISTFSGFLLRLFIRIFSEKS